MEYIDELKKVGESSPKKHVGCGFPNAKILVVAQNAKEHRAISKYLHELFEDYFNVDAKLHMFLIVYDEKTMKSLHVDDFQVVFYTFPDGNYLGECDPAKLFGMQWLSECTVEDGAIQRLFVAHSEAKDDKPERIMFCTYPIGEVSYVIQKCTKLLLYWFLLTYKVNNSEQRLLF